MAIDSLNGSAANQINPATIANRPAPEPAERGKDKENAAQVQAQSNPPPPPNRGQSVDIKV